LAVKSEGTSKTNNINLTLTNKKGQLVQLEVNCKEN